jgi:hypothetical protein
MAVANSLAYYVTATITTVKSFIVQTTGRTGKYRIILKKLAKEKHSSLSPLYVGDEQKCSIRLTLAYQL